MMFEWGKFYEETGHTGAAVVLVPEFGGGDAVDYIFQFMTTYDSFEAYGEFYEKYMNGGFQVAEDLSGKLLTCEVAKLFMGKMIGMDMK